MINLSEQLERLEHSFNINNVRRCIYILTQVFKHSNADDNYLVDPEIEQYLNPESIKDEFLKSSVFQQIVLRAYNNRSAEMLALFFLILDPAKEYTQNILNLIRRSEQYDPAYNPELDGAFIANAFNKKFLNVVLNSSKIITIDYLEQRLTESIKHHELIYTSLLLKVFSNSYAFTIDSEHGLNQDFLSLIDTPVTWPIIVEIINSDEVLQTYYFTEFILVIIHRNNAAALEFVLLKASQMGIELDDAAALYRELMNACIAIEFNAGVYQLAKFYGDTLEQTLLHPIEGLTSSLLYAIKKNKPSLITLLNAVMNTEYGDVIVPQVISILFAMETPDIHLTRGALIYALCMNDVIDKNSLMHLLRPIAIQKLQSALLALPMRVSNNENQWNATDHFPMMLYYLPQTKVQANSLEKLNTLLNQYFNLPLPAVTNLIKLSYVTVFSHRIIIHFDKIMCSLNSVALTSKGMGTHTLFGGLNRDVMDKVLNKMLPEEIQHEFSTAELSLYLQAIRLYLTKKYNPEHPPALRFIACLRDAENSYYSAEALRGKRNYSELNGPNMFAAPDKKRRIEALAENNPDRAPMI